MKSYKTRSKSNSFGTRRTTTTSPNGGKSTYTTSMKTGTGRVATTQKSDGTSYTTHTTRHADGSVSRRRETTYKPKATKSRTRTGKSGGSGAGFIGMATLVLFGLMFIAILL